MVKSKLIALLVACGLTPAAAEAFDRVAARATADQAASAFRDLGDAARRARVAQAVLFRSGGDVDPADLVESVEAASKAFDRPIVAPQPMAAPRPPLTYYYYLPQGPNCATGTCPRR